MKDLLKDFSVQDDFSLEDEMDGAYGGLKDEFKRDPVTGRLEKKSLKSTLNKKKLSKHEMDELFLDF